MHIPEPVWPYANTVPLNPFNAPRTTGFPTCSKIYQKVDLK